MTNLTAFWSGGVFAALLLFVVVYSQLRSRHRLVFVFMTLLVFLLWTSLCAALAALFT